MQQEQMVSGEQAADLAALQGMIEPDMPEEGMQEGDAQAVDPAQQWAMIPAMLGSALSIAMPELQSVYSREACEAWGAAMVPVADKYGWNADGLIGPEVALLAASLPFVIGTYGAIKSKKAELQREAKPEVGQPAAPAVGEYQQQGAKTVSFGAAVEAAAQ